MNANPPSSQGTSFDSASNYRAYVWNAVWLSLLTVVELGVITLSIGQATKVILLFSFAITKMLLVALNYMHLRFETRTLKRLLVVPIPLALLVAYALAYDIPFRWVR